MHLTWLLEHYRWDNYIGTRKILTQARSCITHGCWYLFPIEACSTQFRANSVAATLLSHHKLQQICDKWHSASKCTRLPLEMYYKSLRHTHKASVLIKRLNSSFWGKLTQNKNWPTDNRREKFSLLNTAIPQWGCFARLKSQNLI